MITKKEKQKITTLELRRQILHIIFGMLIVLVIWLDIMAVYHLFLILIVGIILSTATRKYDIFLISWFLKNFEREKDIDKFPGKGIIFFLLGSIIVIALFPKEVALASIMVLTIGDSLATIVGKAIGRYTVSSLKTLEGFGVGIIGGFLGALLFVKPIPAFAGSAVAMLFELVELKFGSVVINDNLSVPLIAALIINFATKYLGGIF